MKIIIFGSASCKFCLNQKEHLAYTFPEDDWLYLDLIKDKEAIPIACDINVEHIPAIVLLNSLNQEIFRRDGGILPPDQLFKKLAGGNNVLPVSPARIIQAQNEKFTILLTYDPELKQNDSVVLSGFDNQKLNDCIVLQSRQINIDKINHMYGAEITDDYKRCGGRKDWAWAVDLLRHKGE